MPRKRRELPWLETRNGVYHAFWYDGAKRRTERFSLRTAEPSEAAHRFAAFLTQGKDIYAGGDKPFRLTVGAAFDFYLEEHVKKNVVDTRRAEDAIANLRPFFGEVACGDLSIPLTEDYATKRMAGEVCLKTKHGKVRKASAGTVKRELNTLVAAVNHCIAWKKPGVTAVDAPRIKKPKTKRSKGLWLFPDELAALREAADQRTRDFIDLAYYTGARRRSIETLTWFQVDLARGRINLAKPDDPETKKRRPIVPISSELLPVLQRLSAEKTNEHVLNSSGSIWSGFKKARRLAGLRDLPSVDMRPAGRLSPHVLRHSRATHLLQRGVPPKAVADLLGDTVATVLRVYGHACPAYIAEAIGEGESQ